jgi:DNA (cytosine-5)-methyltransferase 1
LPFGDITHHKLEEVVPDNFDILCGGFPCQAFSIAGEQKGFEDRRGTLFFEIERLVELRKPKAIFLENVKNLLSHDKGRTFQTILNVLENKLGYHVYHKVLNSMTHANLPQNRERVFIVAFDPKQVSNHGSFQFPNEIPLELKFRDCLEMGKRDNALYYKEEHAYYPILSETMKSQDTAYQWRRTYVRENKSNACPTLTANMGSGGHNVPLILDDYGIRKLSNRECFAFQGFPKNFVLPNMAKSKLYTQAGNSVSVPLVKRIAEGIVEVLSDK